MKIEQNFINLISYNNSINEKQAHILNLTYPVNQAWEKLVLNQEVSKNDMNLLMLLRGDFSLEVQKKIIENYHTVLEHNSIKAKVYTQKIEEKNSPSKDEGFLKIYCDGACSGNPGNAGSGLAIYQDEANPILLYGAYIKNGTNNIAELNALFKALIIAKQSSSQKISIFADSKYAIDCITTWAYSWKKNGWSKKGGEIKNLELIQEAHNLYEKIKDKVEIIHVRGHKGLEGNELADRMAVNAIKEKNEDFITFAYTKIEDVLSMKSY